MNTRNRHKGKLTILVGIDGSGKSTLLSYLESKGYFVSHWKRLISFSLPKSLNFINPAEVVQTLDNQKRLEFIWDYIIFEWKYLIKPALETGRNVISDGFFIRFLVKEKIYKKLPIRELLKRSPLSGKEFIIMVDVPPKIALERKGRQKISPYECFRSPEDFVYFQSLQKRALLKFVKKFPHVIVKGRLPKKELAEKVLLTLQENKIGDSSIFS